MSSENPLAAELGDWQIPFTEAVYVGPDRLELMVFTAPR